MPKNPSLKQTRFLLSAGSPLTEQQKANFKKELKRGTVKIKKSSPVRDHPKLPNR